MNINLRQEKQAEFVQQIKAYSRNGIARLSLRLGKTFIALQTIKEDEVTLVCYPKIKIKTDAWEQDIKKFHYEHLPIVFSTFAGLKKLVKEGKTFSYIICDEIHKLSAAQRESLKQLRTGSILGLTGTLRLGNQKGLKTALNLDVIVNYDLKDAIKDKIVKDYRLFIHFEELDIVNKTFQYKKRGELIWGTEREVYNFYTTQMDYFDEKTKKEGNTAQETLAATLGMKKYMGLRTNFLYNSPTLLRKSKELVERFKDRKTLIFSLRTEVADELAEDVYHSKNINEIAFEEFKLSDNGHLSTVNMISEGVTITGLNTIICHTITSNTEDFQQKLGRGLMLSEVNDELCEIHIICLKNTQQERWTDEACKSLEQDKISYVLTNDVIMPKVEWIKSANPDKELYLYQGGFCYLAGLNIQGYPEYKFLGDRGDRAYTLSFRKLIKI